MNSRLLALPLLALAVPAAASAASSKPVVRHYRAHGTNITTVTMARPGRGAVLEPVLPNGIVSKGTATTTQTSRRLGRYGTAVAINADLYEYATGQASGLFLQDGEIFNQPQGGRPAFFIRHDGRVEVGKPRAAGTLGFSGGRSLPFEVNVKRAQGAVVYDEGWGGSTPADPGATSVLLRIGHAQLHKRGGRWTLQARTRVVRVAKGGGRRIPAEESADLLVQAHGTAGARLKRLARRGAGVRFTYALRTLSPIVDGAVGGGPVLVRNGRYAYNLKANSEFSPAQLSPPDARTAVAQLRDGRIVFFAADQGSGSTGLTTAQVGRELRRLGAVTAMAFDSGGSTAVSINGRLLNKPSDGYERSVGNTLVWFQPAKRYRNPLVELDAGKPARGESAPRLSFTTTREARIEVTFRDPGGREYLVDANTDRPGNHELEWPVDVPKAGTWTVLVDAPRFDHELTKRVVVPRTVAAADTTPGEPAVTKPAAPARPSGVAKKDDGGGGHGAAFWAGLAALIAAACLFAYRQLREHGS